MPPTDFALRVDLEGYAIVPKVLKEGEVRALIDFCELAFLGCHGTRNALLLSRIQELSRSPAIRQLVEPILGAHARAVRAIYFDKLPGANWKVPWHQDLTIAVKERGEVEGFGPWSVKEGVTHVQAPSEVLDSMLSVRVHLDSCGHDNGPLRVIPRSHSTGILRGRDFEHALSAPAVVCLAEAGDIVLMRPLILHASAAADTPSHRRVIHFDFARSDLPAPLAFQNC